MQLLRSRQRVLQRGAGAGCSRGLTEPSERGAAGLRWPRVRPGVSDRRWRKMRGKATETVEDAEEMLTEESFEAAALAQRGARARGWHSSGAGVSFCSCVCGARARLGPEGPSRDAPTQPSCGTAAARVPPLQGAALPQSTDLLNAREPAWANHPARSHSPGLLHQAGLARPPGPPAFPGSREAEGRKAPAEPCGGWPVPRGKGSGSWVCPEPWQPSSGPVSQPGTGCPMARGLLSGKSQLIPACVNGRGSTASRALLCPHQSEHSLHLKRTLFKISDDTDFPRHSTECPSTRSPCPGQPRLTPGPGIPYGNTTCTEDLLLHS
ncbi:collagen alpha-1(I) chain-like [Passer montanus]|uniref:collagen alpha-1(I) chain-like n=1 Tax=Passer montanus TaxID=9160 RepID=UPI00195F6360|nr:collagen alpha-1(I) chain-like [Passer montanus]